MISRRVAIPALLSSLSALAVLTGCASTVVQAPLYVPPNPQQVLVERTNNGAIYQAAFSSGSLFSSTRKPVNIGDVVKVNIDESVKASRKLTTDTSRQNAVADKGPGNSRSGSKLIDFFGNIDASASGSDSYKGSGATDNNSSFSGQIAATVINVLPNGHLLVAGERRIALNGGLSALRFSGVIDPQDIKAGNVIASADVVNARFELAGEGDVSDAASRNWLQRLLTNQMSVW
ncbi:flagellar basal body L-ring protein FlgH [Ideonella sp. B508-1]|uniref:flagellar basal body L-ring protein FlgH n=1 Tax=Ideonella sp. B508-1 TaxID=137716 RepID=UPI0003455D9D|nr:flagellar basal body L-ring protein FlgH [Ideonella sp. B508-1]